MEWTNLVLRWLHVVAGVYWIGQTAYFAWLDGRMAVEGDEASGEGSVWMVHSGGFYEVVRRPPGTLPGKTLHWFKWEAAFTWISGILLFALVYYWGGVLVEPHSELALGRAVGLSLLLMGVAWVAYDLMWLSPLTGRPALGAALSLLVLFAATWGMSRIFTGRATYLQVGAMLGTIMAANVWMRILPAQRRLLAAVAAGRPPDPALAARAKQRSKHNTYLAIPVLFLMISHHFPTAAYGSRWNWALLAAFVVAGLAARRLVEGPKGN